MSTERSTSDPRIDADKKPLAISVVLLPAVAALSANQKLIRCCHNDPQIDAGCATKYCQIPMVIPQMVISFILECANKGLTVPHVWDCVSSKQDHTACCINQGVSPHCLVYCDARTPVPTDMLKYGVCVSEFEKYRVCFRSYLRHHPSVRGDV
ncbi:hypothetical protein Q1695_011498 [Nippostrongylus brasiliensis]|nr:hypothetical protein Q1695_011498 [Nippostrongylus brasiliensis]